MGLHCCQFGKATVVSFLLLLATATVTSRHASREDFNKRIEEDHDKDGHHNRDFDRDVIWGDGKAVDDQDIDDDDVENLSPEEKRKRMILLVQNRIDKNKDGSVSMDELIDWTEHSYNLFEMDDTREVFPDVDHNKDGSIQWQEYAEDTYGAGFNEDSPDFQDPPSAEWEEVVKTYQRERKKFKAADLDESGDLSVNEYLIFKHPRQHNQTEKLVIDETLEASDLNGDGVIDINEFLGDFERKEGADPHWTVMEKEKFEAELDLNKDGVLDGEEILQWVAPNNRALAVEEAEHLMDETDLNHDDKLTVEEILSNLMDWVDSDATDYGRQLLKHHDEL